MMFQELILSEKSKSSQQEAEIETLTKEKQEAQVRTWGILRKILSFFISILNSKTFCIVP